jgi:hypothetical protein
MIEARSPEYLAFVARAEAAQPTTTHRFCSVLHALGKLKRVYTQNIDGLHERVLPADKVVAVHGNIFHNEIVCLDEDPFKMNPLLKPLLDRDFDNQDHDARPDLCLVMGTQLTVFPFNAFPNAVRPRGCPRFFINLDTEGIQAISRNQRADAARLGLGGRTQASTIKIAGKPITTTVDWCTSNSKFRDGQWLICMDCDTFCAKALDVLPLPFQLNDDDVRELRERLSADIRRKLREKVFPRQKTPEYPGKYSAVVEEAEDDPREIALKEKDRARVIPFILQPYTPLLPGGTKTELKQRRKAVVAMMNKPASPAKDFGLFAESDNSDE